MKSFLWTPVDVVLRKYHGDGFDVVFWDGLKKHLPWSAGLSNSFYQRFAQRFAFNPCLLVLNQRLAEAKCKSELKKLLAR